jgi:hypothetical protein
MTVSCIGIYVLTIDRSLLSFLFILVAFILDYHFSLSLLNFSCVDTITVYGLEFDLCTLTYFIYSFSYRFVI